MSVYPSPKLDHNGNLNTIFNSTDFKTSSEFTIARGVMLDICKKNSGTIDIDELNVSDLAAIQDLTVTKLFQKNF
jgi:hypothetical protein